MTLPKVFALVLSLLGLLLAVVGTLALTSGDSGYMRLVGLIAAGGAVLLLVIAAGLFLRKPAVSGESSGLPQRLFRRLIFLAIALYLLGTPLYAVLVSGRMPTLALDNRRMISLKAEPQSFWLMAGLHAVPGVFCLFMALRRPV